MKWHSLLAGLLALGMACDPDHHPQPPMPPGPGSIYFSVPQFNAGESGPNALVTLSRSGGVTGTVSIVCSASAGSASTGSDFSPVSTTVTWADGDGSDKIVAIPLTNDTIAEGDETINVALSLVTGGATLATPSAVIVTILDDDAPNGAMQIGSPSYTVTENGVQIAVMLTRTGGTGGSVSVDYATSDGTATSAADYAAGTGTKTWASGDGSPQTIIVGILEDLLVEGPEGFTIMLANPTGGAVLGSVSGATITIVDNDSPGTLQFSTSALSVSESGATATVLVKRVGGNGGTVSALYASSDGSATAGSDYAATSGLVTFLPGDTTDKTLTVSILNDAVVEPGESFNITLSSPTGGASLGTPSAATVTILDDDGFTVEVIYEWQNGADIYLGGPIPIPVDGVIYYGNKVVVRKAGIPVAVYYRTWAVRCSPKDGGGGSSMPAFGSTVYPLGYRSGGQLYKGSASNPITSMSVTTQSTSVTISSAGSIGTVSMNETLTIQTPTDLKTVLTRQLTYSASSLVVIDATSIALGEGVLLMSIDTFFTNAQTHDADRFRLGANTYLLVNQTGWLLASPVPVPPGVAVEALNGDASNFWANPPYNLSQSPPPNVAVTVSPAPASTLFQGFTFANNGPQDGDTASAWQTDQSITTLTSGSYTLTIEASPAGP